MGHFMKGDGNDFERIEEQVQVRNEPEYQDGPKEPGAEVQGDPGIALKVRPLIGNI
jgi:hypothetical protein